MPTISKDRLAQIIAAARAKKIALEGSSIAARDDRSPDPKVSSLNSSVASVNSVSLKDRLASLKTQYSAVNSNVSSINADSAYAELETETAKTTVEVIESESQAAAALNSGIDKYGHVITYNTEQAEFIALAASGKSAVLIGAAGTGKTTCTRGAIAALIDSGAAGLLVNSRHKYLRDETPGIVCVSYTRRAVANLRKALSTELAQNCMTIHKLLEYEPVYSTVQDADGKDRTTMQFQPARNAYNPLPQSIHTVILDESSMVSLELFHEIFAACPHNPQFIFLGDIQQLPPVFGSAILGFKMLELPTIELIQVYRQALESPIIRLAHRILSGKPINSDEFSEWKIPKQLTLHPWKKKIDADMALMTCAKFFTAAIDSGAYNAEEDMILIPFNKALGTDELNKYIAQHLALKRNAIVHEVIAGFNKAYFSIGDRVLVEKEDGVIIDIFHNPEYLGAVPATASATLDYWGAEQGESHHIVDTDAEYSEDDIDRIMALASSGDSEDRVRQCSHTIVVRMLDTDREVKIKNAAEVNAMLLAYCLTVHKSQGSEWRKVFLVIHQSHATMIQRELLYTACTRAREELYVICEPETFVKGILSQRIKGSTLKEKGEFFKGKVDSGALLKYQHDLDLVEPDDGISEEDL